MCIELPTSLGSEKNSRSGCMHDQGDWRALPRCFGDGGGGSGPAGAGYDVVRKVLERRHSADGFKRGEALGQKWRRLVLCRSLALAIGNWQSDQVEKEEDEDGLDGRER
jgi:hypothetical protein